MLHENLHKFQEPSLAQTWRSVQLQIFTEDFVLFQ